MQAYRAIGTFPNGRIVQKFTQDVVAADEVDARHRVYSFFGSRHGVNSRLVNIASMPQIEPTESSAPAVISAFRATHAFSTVDVAEEESFIQRSIRWPPTFQGSCITTFPLQL